MKMKEWIPQNDKTEGIQLEEEKMPFFATKRGRDISALSMVIVIVVFFSFSAAGNGGAITYQMNEEMLGITCLDWQPLFINYMDITQIELVNALDIGEGINVSDWDSGWCGIYENEIYGIYTLFAYSNVGEYIVVRYRDGILVFNCKNAKNTNSAFGTLKEKCGLD